MITIGEWLNPTRAVGLIAYGTAVICCGIAWVRAKINDRIGACALLTLIESTLLLDIAFNWRWMLHQFLMDIAQRAHEYQVRRIPQLIVLIILAGLLLWGLLRSPAVVSWQRRHFSGGFRCAAVARFVVYRGRFPASSWTMFCTIG